MSAKVVPIRGHEMIPVLEDWLERARKGEIIAISFAAVLKDDVCCEGWAGDLDSCTLNLFASINILRDGFFHQHIDHYSTADNGASE